MWSLMLCDSVDWMMKTAGVRSAFVLYHRAHSRSHTILVAHTLANRYARLVVGVLQDHDLGQLDTQAVSHQFGELTVAVASQELDRVGSHVRPIW